MKASRRCWRSRRRRRRTSGRRMGQGEGVSRGCDQRRRVLPGLSGPVTVSRRPWHRGQRRLSDPGRDGATRLGRAGHRDAAVLQSTRPGVVAAPDPGQRAQAAFDGASDLVAGIEVAHVGLAVGDHQPPARRLRGHPVELERQAVRARGHRRREWCAGCPTSAGAGRGPPRRVADPAHAPRAERVDHSPSSWPHSVSAYVVRPSISVRSTTPARVSDFSRLDSSAGDIFGTPRRRSLKCLLPSSSSRTTSMVHRSSSSSIAFATGQNWPYPDMLRTSGRTWAVQYRTSASTDLELDPQYRRE